MKGGGGMADPRPIGVFDSGVGGIGTLAALMRELPGELLRPTKVSLVR